jgi:hypothetical protein
VVDLFHEKLPELPAVAILNDARRKAIAARCRNELPSREHWDAYFDAVREQPFLLGSNDRNWRADFDWLLKPANITRVIERTYNRDGGHHAA